MLYFHYDKKRLENEFRDPGLPESGIASDKLLEELKNFMDGKVFSSTLAEHLAAFSWLLDHCRIGVSCDDLFVILGFWGIKPIEKLFSDSRRQHVINDFCAGTLATREQFSAAGGGYLFWDYAHSVPDWGQLLDKGIPGVLKNVEDAHARFKEEHAGTVTEEQELFFQSIEMEYRQILNLFDRILELMKQTGCQHASIEAMRSLRYGRAENFYEAMLLIWLYFQISEYGDCIQTRSFGNLDLMLYDRYKKDLESGTFTKEDIRQIIRNFYARVTSMKYFFGHPFYLGGTLADGTSGINELSELFLEEYGNMGVFDPKIQIKLSADTPATFVDQALKLIRSGNNSIVFVGEPYIQKSMRRLGYSAEEARCAIIKGCYEFCARNAVETAPVVLNMPQVFLCWLKDAGEPATFEDFLKSCTKWFKYTIDLGISIANDFEKYLAYVNPAPLFSGLMETALAQGKDGYAMCARYNNSNFWLSGPVTVTDCLTVVKKYVYDRKQITLSQLRTILAKNWEGAEELQWKIRQDKDLFGNNSSEDRICIAFLEELAQHIDRRPNGRGGFYTVALHSADWFIKFGTGVGATPDGRCAGEELTKNFSPRQGGSFSGPTALLSSVLKLESSLFPAGCPVDVMLHPGSVSGDDGFAAMRALLMTYIKQGGGTIHFNIFSSEMLKDAQQHPDRYENLQVRICGWNARWNDLTFEKQKKYLEQAEANNVYYSR